MIQGRYFDGRSSAPQPAQLQIGADGLVRVEGLPQPVQAPLSSVRISDRVGNIQRRIVFADGAVFETSDNDAIDAALEHLDRDGSFSRSVSHWERRWHIAIGALVAVGIVSWLFVQFGVPLLANVAARVLPASVDRAIGLQGLGILDRMFFDDSKLPEERREELLDRFEAMTAPLDDGHEYRLEFRSSEAVGANAFALPSGIVVITDQMVELAQQDEEIVAVLAHEIGHVRGRHALRMILQSAGIGALALALLGDVGTASALAASIPTALIQARHSRGFETEADEFAYQWLRDNGISQKHFSTILKRLEEKYGRHGESDAMASWLSSHPPAAERIRD